MNKGSSIIMNYFEVNDCKPTRQLQINKTKEGQILSKFAT